MLWYLEERPFGGTWTYVMLILSDRNSAHYEKEQRKGSFSMTIHKGYSYEHTARR